jgi:hypothetical protein
MILMEQAPGGNIGGNPKKYVNLHQKSNSNDYIEDSYSQDYLNVQRQLKDAYEASLAAANLISRESGNRVGRA